MCCCVQVFHLGRLVFGTGSAGTVIYSLVIGLLIVSILGMLFFHLGLVNSVRGCAWGGVSDVPVWRSSVLCPPLMVHAVNFRVGTAWLGMCTVYDLCTRCRKELGHV